MRIGIVGSRKSSASKAVQGLISSLPHDSIIISGGCAGPDSWAESFAKDIGLETSIFLPKLPPKGSPKHRFTEAYYARNRLIVKNSDIIHAFVASGQKGGTGYTIDYAIKNNVPVVIHAE